MADQMGVFFYIVDFAGKNQKFTSVNGAWRPAGFTPGRRFLPVEFSARQFGPSFEPSILNVRGERDREAAQKCKKQ